MLKHCAAGHKILSFGSCCYGNHNSFFVFSMTDISAGGEGIALKSWQCVLLKQRYILSSECNFLSLANFLIQSSKILGKVLWISWPILGKGHFLPGGGLLKIGGSSTFS